MKKIGLMLLIAATNSFAAQTTVYSISGRDMRPSFTVNYMYSPYQGDYCYVGSASEACDLIQAGIQQSNLQGGCSVLENGVLDVMVLADQTVAQRQVGVCQ